MSDALPSRISYTDEAIANAAKRDQLNLGWYRFIVKAAERKLTGENGKNPGSLMIGTQVAPLQDPEDANSATRPYVFNNLILPFVNPNKPGHTAPNTAGLMAQFLRAVFDEEIPEMPRRGSDGQLYFEGSAIEKSDEEKCRRDVMKLVFAKCQELWDDPEQLVGQAFYAQIVQNGEYRNVQHPSAELPEGQALVSPSQFTERASVAPAKASGINGKGKPPVRTNGSKARR